MTRDDVIRISRKYVRGVVTGVALTTVLAAIVFWPRLQELNEQPAQVAFTSGLPDDFRVKAEAAFAAYPQSFSSAVDGIAEQDNARKKVLLYEACPNLDPGPQKAGSCVAWGGTTAQYTSACSSALKNGMQPPRDQFSPSYSYGITRVQIGNRSIPCKSDGAYPSDYVRGIKQFGFLYRDEFTEAGYVYSGALDREWGCDGPPRKLIDIGKTRAGGDAYPIRSLTEWRDAIVNGYACTVAIPWKPGRVYRGPDGRSLMAFDGPSQGGHQICSIGYDGSTGKPYFTLFNSHGANWPQGASRADGSPPGSIQVDERWANWIIDNGELWAISDVPGFEADELDLSILR